MALTADQVRADFPGLARRVHERLLVYLDNSATSPTPRPVRQAIDDFYNLYSANVHRGLHTLSEEATAAFEGARARTAAFVGASGPEAVVFTRGSTSAINLVARSWGESLGPGDAILLSVAEHHGNLVPWQMLAARRGVELRFLELTPAGTLDLSALERLLTPEVKLVALAQVSNVLGYELPVATIVAAARAVGARVLLDAAQSVGHLPVDFGAQGVDFLAFSAHKMCGPTGLGCLVARPELLEAMEPIEGGGDMIVHVGLHKSTWNRSPFKFEAGTPPIAQAIGLAAAIDYLEGVGLEWIAEHTRDLCDEAAARLAELPGVRVVGPLTGRLGPVAFTMAGVHPHDIATILDGEGVAIRAGHHCAQPLHELLGLESTARASFYLTNQPSDIDALIDALEMVRKVFG